MVGNAY